MGCMGDREKGPKDETQRWTFITLSDFRCTSAWTYFAYGWLWFMALVGIAVYVVDTFTAVQLLAYNNWSSSVKPALAFKYSKWIFAVCIMLSWALCFYEWFRALRVIKRGGVAESFLDPLAVTLQSMRQQGFKRFLVFTALTKSKKGADYVALFVYFSFKTAIRVVLAEGPRQGVNAMTLWAVLQSDIAAKKGDDHPGFEQFWLNIGVLASSQPLQATIYFGMLFTLVIWVVSAISLIISVVLYLCFLWHYIPQSDGRLSVYCRRKVDRRLAKVVEHKVKAAIEEEERQARKAEAKAEAKRQKNGDLAPRQQISRKPTLPDMGKTPETQYDEKFPLGRQDTTGSTHSLPQYTRDPDERKPTLPQLDEDRPGPPPRSNTQASAWSNAPSYASNAPLMANAGYPGESDLPPLPPLGLHERQDSFGSARSYTPGPPRMQTPMSARPYTPEGNYPPRGPPGPPRMQTPMSARPFSPAENGGNYPPPGPRFPPAAMGQPGPPMRSYTAEPRSAYPGPPMRTNTAEGFRLPPSQGGPAVQPQQSFSRPGPRIPGPYNPAPAPQQHQPSSSYEMIAQPSHTILPARGSGGSSSYSSGSGKGYVAFNPNMSPTSPSPTKLSKGPQRNITVSNGAPSASDYFGQAVHQQRSATAPLQAQHQSGGLLQPPGSERGGTASTRVSEILNSYGSRTPNESWASSRDPSPGSQYGR